MVHVLECFQPAIVIFVFLNFNFFVQSSPIHLSSAASKTELNTSSVPVPCSSFNASALRVLSFDLFGALMLTDSSLHHNIAALLPSLTSTDIEIFTNDWLDAYASYFGKSFPPSLTHQPFLWVIRSSLIQILASFGLSTTVPENSATFNSLLNAWGNLQPRPGVIEVLTRLGAKYQLGLLSNGDRDTLQAALRAFPSSLSVSFIFSSDYPVNCFKPCSAIYSQALAAVHGNVAQVLHVAGSAFDAQGARRCGIYSGMLYDSVPITDLQPCFAFDDIKQLPSFFGL